MKNFPHSLSSDSFSRKYHESAVASTSVEGLVLDHETRWPIQGIKIAIFMLSEAGEQLLVHEMESDNNGYFTGTFQGGANTLVITSLSETYNLSGSYTIQNEGERALECEIVKHGKKQFYTLTLQGGNTAKARVAETKSFSFKTSFQLFFRRLVDLPLLRYFFS